ncbi:MAG: hypothetical protein AVDCRST_MAG49-54, partial [uncultured Thermomicrobiales bacterium]
WSGRVRNPTPGGTRLRRWAGSCRRGRIGSGHCRQSGGIGGARRTASWASR